MNIAERLLRLLIYCFSLIGGLSGCQSVSYYSQSVVGHSQLMLARQPIEKAIKTAPPSIAEKLELTTSVLTFAKNELSLTVGNSYKTYVPLERDFPVWVVIAASEFDLQPKQWCYWVIGCASYRGYFSESSAKAYARKLHEKGWQTHVTGAPAYSTLGWFADPLLPSMMRYGDAALVEILLHELTHRQFFLKHESAFNEAFATFVGQQGAELFLNREAPKLLSQFRARNQATRRFSQSLQVLKETLKGIYQSAQTDDLKRKARTQAIEEFKRRYLLLKETEWQGHGYFDEWLSGELNNAKLASFSTYHRLVPKFEMLFNRCRGDFTAFFSVLAAKKQAALSSDCKSGK